MMLGMHCNADESNASSKHVHLLHSSPQTLLALVCRAVHDRATLCAALCVSKGAAAAIHKNADVTTPPLSIIMSSEQLLTTSNIDSQGAIHERWTVPLGWLLQHGSLLGHVTVLDGPVHWEEGGAPIMHLPLQPLSLRIEDCINAALLDAFNPKQLTKLELSCDYDDAIQYMPAFMAALAPLTGLLHLDIQSRDGLCPDNQDALAHLTRLTKLSLCLYCAMPVPKTFLEALPPSLYDLRLITDTEPGAVLSHLTALTELEVVQSCEDGSPPLLSGLPASLRILGLCGDMQPCSLPTQLTGLQELNLCQTLHQGALLLPEQLAALPATLSRIVLHDFSLQPTVSMTQLTKLTLLILGSITFQDAPAGPVPQRPLMMLPASLEDVSLLGISQNLRDILVCLPPPLKTLNMHGKLQSTGPGLLSLSHLTALNTFSIDPDDDAASAVQLLGSLPTTLRRLECPVEYSQDCSWFSSLTALTCIKLSLPPGQPSRACRNGLAAALMRMPGLLKMSVDARSGWPRDKWFLQPLAALTRLELGSLPARSFCTNIVKDALCALPALRSLSCSRLDYDVAVRLTQLQELTLHLHDDDWPLLSAVLAKLVNLVDLLVFRWDGCKADPDELLSAEQAAELGAVLSLLPLQRLVISSGDLDMWNQDVSVWQKELLHHCSAHVRCLLQKV
jgi:hypothetical protein